jgi:hypothetical protein
MFCYLPDWANTLLLIGGIVALVISRYRLIERTEQRVHQRRDEMDAWNRMSPPELADWLIYGEHDLRPYRPNPPTVKPSSAAFRSETEGHP